MSEGAFFGYGSLVNGDTYPTEWELTPATLTGWRRAWAHRVETPEGPIFSLSVRERAGESIDGVVVAPRTAQERIWLDAREAGYAKRPLASDDIAPAAAGASVVGAPLATYQSLSDASGPQAVILLSYLDAVLQGFIRHFGPDGARRFMRTTDGWDAPIFDDRAAPRYPRSIRLSEEERALIDALRLDIPS